MKVKKHLHNILNYSIMLYIIFTVFLLFSISCTNNQSQNKKEKGITVVLREVHPIQKRSLKIKSEFFMFVVEYQRVFNNYQNKQVVLASLRPKVYTSILNKMLLSGLVDNEDITIRVFVFRSGERLPIKWGKKTAKVPQGDTSTELPITIYSNSSDPDKKHLDLSPAIFPGVYLKAAKYGDKIEPDLSDSFSITGEKIDFTFSCDIVDQSKKDLDDGNKYCEGYVIDKNGFIIPEKTSQSFDGIAETIFIGIKGKGTETRAQTAAETFMSTEIVEVAEQIDDSGKIKDEVENCGNGKVEGDEICDRTIKYQCNKVDTKFVSGISGCINHCKKFDVSTCEELKINSSPPPVSKEGTPYIYKVNCSHSSTALKSDKDTCGGVLSVDGTYTFTPKDDQAGDSCDLAVLCKNGDTQVQQTTTIAINALPKISVQLPIEVKEHNEAIIDLNCNDKNSSDNPVLSITEDSCNGSYSAETGKYSYTPKEAMGGQNCKLTLLCKSSGDEITKEVLIEVAEVASPPVIDSFAPPPAKQDLPYLFKVLCSDADDGDIPEIKALTGDDNSCGGEVDSEGNYTFNPTDISITKCNIGVKCSSKGADITEIKEIEIDTKPIITSGPTGAQEDEPFSYTLICSDSNGDVPVYQVLSGDDNSCGGTIIEGVYIIPKEKITDLSGTKCNIGVKCLTSEFESVQKSEITVKSSPKINVDPSSNVVINGSTGTINELNGIFKIKCDDKDGDSVALSAESNHNCPGGTITNGVFSYIPTEADGGGKCIVDLKCTDQLKAALFQIDLDVIEEIEDPVITSLISGNIMSTHWNSFTSGSLSVSDDNQTIDIGWSLANITDCNDTLDIIASSDKKDATVFYTCKGVSENDCNFDVVVTDKDSRTDSSKLSVKCENNIPSLSTIATIPPVVEKNKTTFDLSCSDADSDSLTIYVTRTASSSLSCPLSLSSTSSTGNILNSYEFTAPKYKDADSCAFNVMCSDSSGDSVSTRLLTITIDKNKPQLFANAVTGSSSSNPAGFYYVDTKGLFFIANDGNHGYELWFFKDGALEPQMIIPEINDGYTSAFPSVNFTIFNRNQKSQGQEIPMMTGEYHPDPQFTEVTTVSGEKYLYFVADDGDGEFLWRIDLDAATFIPEKISLDFPSDGYFYYSPKHLTSFNNTLYFSMTKATIFAGSGNRFLYKVADNTAPEIDKIELVSQNYNFDDFNEVSAHLLVVDTNLYFSARASDGENGFYNQFELAYIDSTSTLQTITNPVEYVINLANIGGALYYKKSNDGHEIKKFISGSEDVLVLRENNISVFKALGSALYIGAYDYVMKYDPAFGEPTYISMQNTSQQIIDIQMVDSIIYIISDPGSGTVLNRFDSVTDPYFAYLVQNLEDISSSLVSYNGSHYVMATTELDRVQTNHLYKIEYGVDVWEGTLIHDVALFTDVLGNNNGLYYGILTPGGDRELIHYATAQTIHDLNNNERGLTDPGSFVTLNDDLYFLDFEFVKANSFTQIAKKLYKGSIDDNGTQETNDDILSFVNVTLSHPDINHLSKLVVADNTLYVAASIGTGSPTKLYSYNGSAFTEVTGEYSDFDHEKIFVINDIVHFVAVYMIDDILPQRIFKVSGNSAVVMQYEGSDFDVADKAFYYMDNRAVFIDNYAYETYYPYEVVSDGTSNTKIVKFAGGVYLYSTSPSNMFMRSGEVYLTAPEYLGDNTLYKYVDPSWQGVASFSYNSTIDDLIVVNGKLFYIKTQMPARGELAYPKLYSIDSAATAIGDFDAVFNLYEFDGKLFFMATKDSSIKKLYSLDPSTEIVTLVANSSKNYEVSSHYPVVEYTTVNSELYMFSDYRKIDANDKNFNYIQLWNVTTAEQAAINPKSDALKAPYVDALGVSTSRISSQLANFFFFKDRLFFTADNGTNGYELMYYDLSQ